MMTYNIAIFSIVNVLRVLLLKKAIEVFLPLDEGKEKKRKEGFGIYYLFTLIIYCMFKGPIIYEICSFGGILGLTFLYQEIWEKKIWVSLMIFSIDMACSLTVQFAFAENGVSQQPAIQTLLFLICVTVISHIFYPDDNKKAVFDKRQNILLTVIAAAGIFALCVLLYGKFEGTPALLLCLATLFINLCVLYLYNVMLENSVKLREGEIYKQQTYAYQNQLEVIMESQNRIRALKHDMKNHILAIQTVLQKKDVDEAQKYLDSMQDFMTNPSEYVNTGNNTIDSLLNYKIQKAKEVLERVEVKLYIPEKLTLHSFDLNVVLGNLLDNAIEASVETEEKSLTLSMKLEKGLLLINIRNNCHGIENGKRKSLDTTKTDRLNHGIGLKNVQRIVEKYHGDMDLNCKNGIMEADILMYIKEM